MPEYTDFGFEVRVKLLKKKKSMTKFAKELGISCSYLSEILKGTRDGKSYKDKIAQSLDIGVNLQGGGNLSE